MGKSSINGGLCTAMSDYLLKLLIDTKCYEKVSIVFMIFKMTSSIPSGKLT